MLVSMIWIRNYSPKILVLNPKDGKNNICVTGPFRSIYLEGPPNRGENKSDYITQIAVPIKP